MKKVLLFIDDNKSLLFVIKRALSKHYKVNSFSNSEEAIDFINKSDEEPDVILCDYKMPRYNGVEVLKKAKERYVRAVRILFTGYADQIDIEKNKDIYHDILDKNILKSTKEIIGNIEKISQRNK